MRRHIGLIKIAAAALSAALLLGVFGALLTAWAETPPGAAGRVKKPSLGALPNGLSLLSMQGDLVLSYDMDARALYVDDLKSGAMWSSAVTEDRFDFEEYGINLANRQKFSSLFHFWYVDTSNNRGTPQPVFSEDVTVNNRTDVREWNASLRADKIQDGVRLQYGFSGIGIEITMEIFLENGKLVALVPSDGIVENGSNVVLTIDMLPNMGAADRFTEGYILIPQGSGSIARFDTFLETPDVAPMEFGIYGRKNVRSWDYWANAATDYGYYEALLPLYGVKHGSAGFLAVAESGEFDAGIYIAPGTDTVPLTYSCFRFTMRYQFEVTLSNLNGQNATSATMTDRARIERDCEVSYTFLSGDDANYSGMAREYRARLIGEGALGGASLDGEMPLGIEIFFGAREQNANTLNETYVTMTTYEQGLRIVEMLEELGVTRMDVSLQGWYKGGYGEWLMPSNLSPERRLGGKAGFAELAGSLSDKCIDVYARVNYMLPGYANNSYSSRNDLVLRGSGLGSLLSEDGDQAYILRAVAGLRLLNKGLKAYSGYGAGILFEQAGLYMYHEYTRAGDLIPRSEVSEGFIGQMAATRSASLPAAIEGANKYLLPYVTRIYDLPIWNGGYSLFDEAVPFMSLVIHGSIPYTANPGNLFYNHQAQLLKWVEYGALPFYQLTWEHPREFKYTNANWMFSSIADDWAPRAAEQYLDMRERLGETWGRQMLSHDRPVPGVAVVEYEGGYKAYINYNEWDEAIDGITIPALDYKVVRQ